MSTYVFVLIEEMATFVRSLKSTSTEIHAHVDTIFPCMFPSLYVHMFLQKVVLELKLKQVSTLDIGTEVANGGRGGGIDPAAEEQLHRIAEDLEAVRACVSSLCLGFCY